MAEAIAGDAGDYLSIAYSLARTGVFGRLPGLEGKGYRLLEGGRLPLSGSTAPDGSRPPFWPVLLSIFIKISAYDLKTILLLRFLVDAVTIVVFYRALHYFELSTTGRMIALGLFALHPAWLLYSATLLSEPLTMLVHIGFAVSMLEIAGRVAAWRLAIAGLSGGLTLLVHPFYVLLPLTLAVTFWLAGLIKRRDAGIVVLLASAVATPWIIRNMVVFHTMRPMLTTLPGKSVLRGWNPQFLDQYRNTTGDLVVVEAGEDTRDLTPLQVSNAYTRTALRFAGKNWRLVPAIITRKVTGALTPFPETPRAGILENGRTFFQVLTFCAVVVMLALRRSGWLAWLLGAEYTAYLVMSIATVPVLRYRFPLIWVELIAVVAVGEYGWRLLKSRVRAGIAPEDVLAGRR